MNILTSLLEILFSKKWNVSYQLKHPVYPYPTGLHSASPSPRRNQYLKFGFHSSCACLYTFNNYVCMGVDFEFPVTEGIESECTSEAHRQKSQAKKRLETQVSMCSCPVLGEGEWMSNRGEDKSELFLLIPKAQQTKDVTLCIYQQFIMVKVFKMISQSLLPPSHLRGRTEILVSFYTWRDWDAEKVHNELTATKLVTNRTDTRAHFLVFILRPQAVSTKLQFPKICTNLEQVNHSFKLKKKN